MQVVGEPFMTREAIVSILHLGQVMTESRFRTLRVNHAASSGMPITMRTAGGQVVGSLRLYSALNGDAARAFRRRELDLARTLAGRAQELEHSRESQRVRAAVAAVAGRMPARPDRTRPGARSGELAARRQSSGPALDLGAHPQQWLAQSAAWLTQRDDDVLEAVVELSTAIERTRTELVPEADATTFYGTVARMDDVVAEVEGAAEQALLVPRAELERQGLARLGQAVAVLRETLLGGGSFSLASPAVPVGADTLEDRSPFAEDLDALDDVAYGAILERRDWYWIDRVRTRRPSSPLAAPFALS